MILFKKLVSLIHLLENIFRIVLSIQLNHPKVCHSKMHIKANKIKAYISQSKKSHIIHSQLLELDSLDSNYEAPSMPRGFVYQIIIFSTWGDSYYVGLNGIQIYDNYGNEIKLTTDSMFSLCKTLRKI